VVYVYMCKNVWVVVYGVVYVYICRNVKVVMFGYGGVVW